MESPAAACGWIARVGGRWWGSKASPGHQVPLVLRTHTSSPNVSTSIVYPCSRVMRTACPQHGRKVNVNNLLCNDTETPAHYCILQVRLLYSKDLFTLTQYHLQALQTKLHGENK